MWEEAPRENPCKLGYLSTLNGLYDVNVSVNGCLSICVSHVFDWRPVQGMPHLSPNVSWDWLQPPTTLQRISWYS